MEFTIEKETNYTPDVYNNLDLAEEDQVVVTIRTPNASETAAISNLQNAADSTNLIAGVARFVTAISNLKVNGKPVTNGREMAAAQGMYVFALNIGSHILGMLTEIEPDPT